MNIPSHEYCKECKDWNGSISNCMEICGIPMDIIKEWEKYHAIGTPEECRAAVEKQRAKKPKEYEDKFYGCPTCGNVLLHKWEKYPTKLMDKKNGLPYCLGCGQRILWEV